MAREVAREKTAAIVTALVPLGLVTFTGPLCAPAGTTTPVMLVLLATVKPVVTVLVPAAPVKVMVVVPVRLVPVRAMVLPGTPMKGLSAVRVGTWASTSSGRKSASATPVRTMRAIAAPGRDRRNK